MADRSFRSENGPFGLLFLCFSSSQVVVFSVFPFPCAESQTTYEQKIELFVLFALLFALALFAPALLPTINCFDDCLRQLTPGTFPPPPALLLTINSQIIHK